jgi:hypothetical protein
LRRGADWWGGRIGQPVKVLWYARCQLDWWAYWNLNRKPMNYS